MAKIIFEDLSFNYGSKPNVQPEWVLKNVSYEWKSGGAYALLGPSGCGKTTILNLISGLLYPTSGKIYFDETDVSKLDTKDRNIAQVFQFPVVYDTMTVYQNLSFPIRNRKLSKTNIDSKVREIAKLLELDSILKNKASLLTSDQKQKISMGRGLVRDDVNAILFDEPLTVVDPAVKWQLRYNLKELHRKFDHTMIYVTHDQTEAMTFADYVMVMLDGKFVQIGKPQELVEKPIHTFVGHFIGSPGINLFPCEAQGRSVKFQNIIIPVNVDTEGLQNLELGIRPEYIAFSDSGFEVRILSVKDLGVNKLVSALFENHPIKIVVPDNETVPEGKTYIHFKPDKVFVYHNKHLIE